MRFRLRKDSVSDVVKLLETMPMQQVLIVLRFHPTGTFQKVIVDSFGVSAFAACAIIHKVLRAIVKRKDNSCHSQRTWLVNLEKFYDV